MGKARGAPRSWVRPCSAGSLGDPKDAHACGAQGAAVFVSGAAQRMPQDVAAAFQAVAVAAGGLTPAAAAQYVRQLALSGRYFVEAWS
jgi:hypothetical protein